MIEMYLHKPPMKTLLYCRVRAYSIKNSLEIINAKFELGLTEENIITWNHISQEEALKKKANTSVQ